MTLGTLVAKDTASQHLRDHLVSQHLRDHSWYLGSKGHSIAVHLLQQRPSHPKRHVDGRVSCLRAGREER
eukprot:1065749-Rhodomonas_salina.1